MKKVIITLGSFAIAAFIFSGCASSNTAAGAVTGAAVGGLAGAMIGDHDTAMVGAAGGAVAGALIGQQEDQAARGR